MIFKAVREQFFVVIRGIDVFKIMWSFFSFTVGIDEIGVAVFFPGCAADSMAIGGLMGYDYSAFAFVHDIGLILFLYFDGKIKILLCSVIDGDIVGKKLFASG